MESVLDTICFFVIANNLQANPYFGHLNYTGTPNDVIGKSGIIKPAGSYGYYYFQAVADFADFNSAKLS